nr:hypothetical protein GCM10025699_12150 [Microbacterium flavescens]
MKLEDAIGRRAGQHHAHGVGAREEELEHSGVHAHRHPQSRAGGGQMDVADRGEHAIHVPGGVRGVLGVVVAAEEDEQRVARELEDVTAVVGRGEEHGEDARQRRDELLGPLAPRGGELLGQGREARDVDEHGGAVHAQSTARRPAVLYEQTGHEVRRRHASCHATRSPENPKRHEPPNGRVSYWCHYLTAHGVSAMGPPDAADREPRHPTAASVEGWSTIGISATAVSRSRRSPTATG